MGDLYGGHGEIWQQWLTTGDQRTRDQLVALYQPLVRIVAVRARRTLVDRADVDDLMSHGQIGLLDAIARFDPEQNVTFDFFASKRIRFAMIDGLRKFDSATRNQRRQVKTLHRALEHLRHRFGREPTDTEVAGYLGVSEMAVHRLRLQELVLDPSTVPADDDEDVDGEMPASALADTDPSSSADVAEFRQTVALAMSKLEGPGRMVLGLYYVEGFRMSDIARLMGVSVATVSKIHGRGLVDLRRLIEDIGSAWAPAE